MVDEAWRKDALCIEYGDIDWFADRGTSIEPARDVCARCLVSDECLTFALSAPETLHHGIWGGTTPQERRRLLKAA